MSANINYKRIIASFAIKAFMPNAGKSAATIAKHSLQKHSKI